MADVRLFTIEGVDETLRELAGFGSDTIEAAHEALGDEARDIMADSQIECPYLTGALRKSARVDDVSDSAVSAFELSYNTDYAFRVHENLEARHTPPTKAKYLEDPLRRSEAGLVERVAARIRGSVP